MTTAPGPTACGQRILGVLGGMGPLASLDFARKVLDETDARSDQAGIPMVIWNDPTVPDRTAALLGHGPSPLPKLLAGIAALERSGAHAIAMPCNTAHAWYEDLSRATVLPILHIAHCTLGEMRERVGAGERVAVLATRGTIQTCVYQELLGAAGFFPVIDEQSQPALDETIRRVKSGDAATANAVLAPVLATYVKSGVGAMVLACTELPLALSGKQGEIQGVPILDTTAALARASVRWWRRSCDNGEVG